MTSVRVRGIYTTALTRLLDRSGYDVVQASEPIRRRFDADFPVEPATTRVWTSRDRLGVEVSGDPTGVGEIADQLAAVAVDALAWSDPLPRGAIFDGAVVDTAGGGAVVDFGDGLEGYLPYDAVDGYVDVGDHYRLQVHEPAPPWDDDRPLVRPDLTVGGALLTLTRGKAGIDAAVDEDRVAELVGLTDLLDVSPPEGWGLTWEPAALEAGTDAMAAALADAVETADAVDDALGDESCDSGAGNERTGTESSTPSRRRYVPAATRWIRFGRESRLALDRRRRSVVRTMPGHHRIKAGSNRASTAVDFAEAVSGDRTWGPFTEPGVDPNEEGEDETAEDEATADEGNVDEDGVDYRSIDESFPFRAVVERFGPDSGDRVAIEHGKPDGRTITLGTGTVTAIDRDDWRITVEREMRPGGTYDALGVPKEGGDVAETRFTEGRWWYPTVYRDEDGVTKGTYVNVCTPLELFPGAVTYVDLYVDVIRHADGTVERVDDDELDAAEADGIVPTELAAKARAVARAVERALS